VAVTYARCRLVMHDLGHRSCMFPEAVEPPEGIAAVSRIASLVWEYSIWETNLLGPTYVYPDGPERTCDCCVGRQICRNDHGVAR
jgi:hypothetical protein